jgi:hypothetical protein
MKMSKFLTPLVCVLIPLIIGSLSGLANIGSLDTWYA